MSFSVKSKSQRRVNWCPEISKREVLSWSEAWPWVLGQIWSNDLVC